MSPGPHPNRLRAGMSLVETMCSITVMIVAVTGASAYSYKASLDNRRAKMRLTAVRHAMLLCESWRGVDGDETFDPAACFASELDIAVASQWTGTAHIESGFVPLGTYAVNSDGFRYGFVLSWRDVNARLRALNVVVCWPIDESVETRDEQQTLVKLTSYCPK